MVAKLPAAKTFSPSSSFQNLVPIISSRNLSTQPSLSSSPSSSSLNLHPLLVKFLHLFHLKKFISAKTILKSFASFDETHSHHFPSLASSILNSCNHAGISPSEVFDMLFRIYSDTNNLEKALATFEFMLDTFGAVSSRSCSVYIQALRRHGRMDSALQFFQRILESDAIDVSVHTTSILVDGLCKNGEVEAARKVLDEMRRKGLQSNIFSYNSLIKAYGKREDFDSLDEVLSLLENNKIEQNVVTFALLIDAFSSHGKLDKAEKAFEEVSRRGLNADIFLYTSMINAYCREGNIKKAFSLFDECVERGIQPTEKTYGALINGLCKAGQIEATNILIIEMQQKGFDVNLVIFNTLIDGYCKKGMVGKALELKEVIEKKGLELDIYLYNTIAAGLCRSNQNNAAAKLLHTMIDKGIAPNIVSYTTMIDIHCKEGDLMAARRLFREMDEKGLKPNVVSYNVMIDGYCKKGSVREAERLKKEMEKKGILGDVYTYTSLIHGHCISGKVDVGMKLFEEMEQRGVVANCVAYTALISGLSKQGRSNEALRLYDKMLEIGLVPDDSVYSAIWMLEIGQCLRQIEQWVRQQPAEQLYIAVAVVVIASTLLFLLHSFNRSKANTIIIAGLSGSGKTILFYQLRDGSSHQGTVTSMEPNDDIFVLHSEVEKKDKTKPVRVVDVPGHSRLRPKLDEFLPQAAGLIFVVDALDFLPNCRAAAEYLYDILTKATIVKKKIPVLILCNKTDKVTAHSKEFIRKQLEKEIDKLRTSRIAISTADVTNEYTLGVPGEAFSFSHCQNQVTVAEASGLTGEVSQAEQFMRDHVKP